MSICKYTLLLYPLVGFFLEHWIQVYVSIFSYYYKETQLGTMIMHRGAPNLQCLVLAYPIVFLS